MNTLRVLPLLLGSLVLAGCATQKQAMSEDKYDEFARAHHVILQCGSLGKIDSDLAARGFTYLASGMKEYFYYSERMNACIEYSDWKGYIPSDTECNQLAIAIQKRKQQISTYNQGTQSNQSVSIESPKHTVCNRIGTQTMCTTY